MEAWALTDAEVALFKSLNQHGVRFVVVGLGAALLEGAGVATQDIDLWLDRVDASLLDTAAREAGGFWISGFGMQPPAFGGEGLERLDIVLHAHGLESFDTEYARSRDYELAGVKLKVLPLERVLASKLATNRPKDRAQVPALEAALAARKQQEAEK